MLHTVFQQLVLLIRLLLIQLERVWIGVATNQWLASDFQTAFFDVEGFER